MRGMAAWVALTVCAWGCSPAAPVALDAALSPPPIAPAPETSITAPPPPVVERDDIGLHISFHPGLTTNIGWAQLPEPVPLHMLGNPGAAVARGVAYTAGGKLKTYQLERFQRELQGADLANTSIVVQESTLCSNLLRDEVAAKQPARLLLNVQGGLTAAGVACLQALSTPKLYLTTCLYRSHRDAEACDGDAELALLRADAEVRGRVFGLAVSLSQAASLRALAEFPTLEYLAVVAGRDPETSANFDALPLAALDALRYLDVTNFQGESWGLPPLHADRLGRLHTLRWHGDLRLPLPNCRLRRLSDGVLTSEDVDALAGCSSLVELSSDSVSLDSAKRLVPLSKLERLHLRHFRGTDMDRIGELVNLRALDLTANDQRDFSFIAKLTKLERVDLSQTSVTSLEMLRNLDQLQHVDVSSTPVNDLTPLQPLAGLVELDVGQTRVVDLSPVAKMKSLRELHVGKTGVASLKPLARLPLLEWVSLYETPVADVGVLFTLPSLKRVNIMGLTLPEAQVKRLKAQLGVLHVND